MSKFDTSMYSQIRPVQIQSPFELQSQFDELQRAKNQNRLAQMQFDEAGRAEKERNALADLSRQYGNSPEYAQELMRGGYGQQAGAQLQAEAQRRKADADSMQQDLQNDKLRGDVDAQKFKITKEKHDEAIQRLGAIRKNPGRNKSMIIGEINSEIEKGNVKPSQAAPLLDKIGQLPDDVRALDALLDQITTGMQTAQQQAESISKQRDDDYRAKNDKINQGLTRSGQALTKRGQDLTDARSRETNEKTKLMAGKADWTYDAGSNEFVKPPTAENPLGQRSGNSGSIQGVQAFKYLAGEMIGTKEKPGVLSRAMTGGPIGAIGMAGRALDSQDAMEFDNIREQMSTQVRAIFRIPGEGALTNMDLQQYGIQLPDRRYTKDANERIISRLFETMKIRTGPVGGPATAQPPGPSPQQNVGGVKPGGIKFLGFE